MVETNALEKLLNIYGREMGAVDDLITLRMESENASRIPEITKHLTGAGGKRIRPLLTIASADLCGYQGDHHVKLATTVEFIHTATLLHDDVVDESEKRRGRTTANRLWDNKSSILVGDYLFSRSFQLMVETESLDVLRILANASAVIAEGEVLQLQAASNLELGEDTYFKVIEGKTAALFAAACEVGGVIASASDAHVSALHDYGLKLGLAFQIADDVLDYMGGEEFGKTSGNDFAERKLTLPVLRALAKADSDEHEFWSRTIGKGDQGEGDLARAMEIMNAHGAMESARQTALQLSADAKAALGKFPQSDTRDLMIATSDLVVKRLV